MKDLLSVAFVAVGLAGCSCGSPFPNFHIPDYPTPEDAGETYLDCLSQELPDATSILAADAQLAALSEGSFDLPLSAGGCWRVSRTVADGKVTAFQITRQLGPDIDSMTGRISARAPVVLARLRVEPDGSVVREFDADPDEDDPSDDFFELVERVEASSHTVVRTTYNPASREVASRLTLARDANGPTRTLDVVQGGVLTPGTTEPVTAEQYSAGGDGPNCVHRECTADEIRTLENARREMTQKSWDCLTDMGRNPGQARARKMVELTMQWSEAHSFSCVSNCNFVGRWCLSCQQDGGPLSMEIDPSTPNLPGIIGHEFAHGYIDVHASELLPLIDAAANGDSVAQRMRDAADPMYACEAYCFGGTVNRCTCARCLGVRACDPPCRDLPSCTVEDDVLPGTYWASEAVGAICDPLVGTPTWHLDMRSCESSCSVGGSCTSYSVSCDSSCK
jgi:hypothetical protein